MVKEILPLVIYAYSSQVIFKVTHMEVAKSEYIWKIIRIIMFYWEVLSLSKLQLKLEAGIPIFISQAISRATCTISD